MAKLYLFLRAFSSACRSITSVKWKAVISILTILIGALAITTTFTISSNVDVYVDHLINENGGPRVTVMNFAPGAKFTNKEIQKFKKISVVKKVYAADSQDIRFRLNSVSSMLTTHAVTSDNWLYLPYKIKSGHFISPQSHPISNVVVLSPVAAKKFSSETLIGKYINIKVKGKGELRFKVIGIAEPSEGQFDSGAAWVHIDNYKLFTGKKTLSTLHVVGQGPDWMNWIEVFSKKTLDQDFRNNFFINNPLSSFLEAKNQLVVFIHMGYVLGILALIAGAIGSTSVMILNVNLRRKEIGLYKSMGFSSSIILVQFTCETLVLSLTGGVIGGILGSGLGYFISADMFPVAKLSFLGFGLGLISATLTGLCFGLIPAYLAAKMDPVKALQG
jgi:putative ABC transport system permease protein